jgi:hypothetical protein
LACGLYPLSASFGFQDTNGGTIAVLNVVVPLPIFSVDPVSTESAPRFLVKIETEVERIVGSDGPKEH